MDGFDQLPDSLILQIFSSVSDVKTLTWCRSICKRFNSLIPKTDFLTLNVDRVISPDSHSYSLLLHLINILLKPIFKSQAQAHPAQILSPFTDARYLTIQLPRDNLPLYNEKRNGDVKWWAEFGESFQSCVVLGYRYITESDEDDCQTDFAAGGFKEKVMWSISALMAASARHCMLREVVKKSKHLVRVILKDKQGKGTVVMDRNGLKECWAAVVEEGGIDGGGARWLAVKGGGLRMRIRKMNKVRLGGGWVVGATLVVVRPSWVAVKDDDVDDDAELALKAFGCGMDKQVVEILLKTSRSYQFEINSL